jgi:superfamily II DNA or RNA helicase
VVVVDEAHGTAGNSDRHEAAAVLCRRAAYVLLLTATPHSGDDEQFTSLCALGSCATQPAPEPDLLVFRRSRAQAGRNAGRRVHTLRVQLTTGERAMHAALTALTREVLHERAHVDGPAWLMLSMLHKRGLSSAHALAISAERRLALLQSPGQPVDLQVPLPFDPAGELDDRDSAPMWSEPALRDRRTEERLLQHVIRTARLASASESKLNRLRRLLDAIDEPAIVFTEFRDTLLHVRHRVAPLAPCIHGGLSREQRRAALELLPQARLLLATDAAGEGLNLQKDCRVVVNLELPWNPMRLEQRIGRVDRIGQSKRVHAFHLVADETGETALLERLSSRVSLARVRVGASDPLHGHANWTEDMSARLIVSGTDLIPWSGTQRSESGAVPLTRLDEAAALEQQRLLVMRRVAASARGGCDICDRPGSRAPLVTRLRRSALRGQLEDRTLAIFRTAVVDGDGRTVAARLDSVLFEHSVNTTGSPHSVSTLEEKMAQITTLVAGLGGRRRWLEASIDISSQFASRRRDRARTLFDLLPTRAAPIQPGLFDRRSEREHDAELAARHELSCVAEDRLARAGSAGRLSVSGPTLVLMLSPRQFCA